MRRAVDIEQAMPLPGLALLALLLLLFIVLLLVCFI
jgi:hypothetical protein